MVLRKKKKRHRDKPAKPRKPYSEAKIKQNRNMLSVRAKLFLIFANPFGWLFILIVFAYGKDVVVNTFGTQTDALITDRLSNPSRGDASQEFIYEFEYNGKMYEGNSQIDSKRRDRIGDHIDVVFIKFLPSINKPSGSSSVFE